MVQNDSRKGGENLGKFGAGPPGGSLCHRRAAQGAPKDTRPLKMEPKETPELPKCDPEDLQSLKKFKNEAQGSIRAAKMDTHHQKHHPEFPKWVPSGHPNEKLNHLITYKSRRTNQASQNSNPTHEPTF